jgi:hypothetical protein
MAGRKKRKNPLAVALGRKGGKARVARMSAEELREHARHMVQAREARRHAKKKSS